MNSRHKTKKGPCKSKNLVTERNRRQRINNGILSVHPLVPKIAKVSTALANFTHKRRVESWLYMYKSDEVLS